MEFELPLSVFAFGIALFMRPWRQLRGTALLSPMLAALVVLPWLWALPRLHSMPLQLQFSGACAVLLLLGWPLAVITLTLVGIISMTYAPASMDVVIGQIFWLGIFPGTLALLMGALLRRFTGTHPFVYILGRGFLGTVACIFASLVLASGAGHELAQIESGLANVAYWLMAWGEGFLTGMMAAVFVAFHPEWLATWSDKLYLPKPPSNPF